MAWAIPLLFPEAVEDYITAMNQGYFLMRGLNKVGAEMSLTVLSYNLKRAINILGVQKLIEAVT